MAVYTLAPQPWLVLLDDAGLIIPAGQLAIYAAGTTTPATVYTTADGIAHPFPITLDGAGRVPGGLYLQPGQTYKFVLHAPQIEEPLDGAIIKTQDHVGAVPLAGGATRKVVTAGDYPDLNVAGVNILEYEGAGDIHIRGLGGGVLGQTLLILNNSTSTIWLYHNDPAAPGASRMSNFVLIGPTPIAPGRGSAQYTYTSGNYWAMTTHAQGDAIGQPYDPANYGTVNAGVSWTVEAVDALAETFTLNGRTLFYSFLLQNTAVSGVSQTLTRRLPYGWQARTVASTNMILSVDGGATRAVGGVIAVDPLHLGFQRVPADGWPVGANNITVLGQLAVPLD